MADILLHVVFLGPLTDDPSVIYDGRKLMIEDKDRDELKDYCDKKRQTGA